MQSGGYNEVDVARLKADVAAAGVEMLSAHCAADRVRLHYSPQDVVAYSERKTLRKAIASAEAVYRFFALLKIELKNVEESSR